MHRFFSKKKTDDCQGSSSILPRNHDRPRTVHSQSSKSSLSKSVKPLKQASRELPSTSSVDHALPSTDDFRTSLLMPDLSARFTFLRHVDSSNSTSARLYTEDSSHDFSAIHLSRHQPANGPHTHSPDSASSAFHTPEPTHDTELYPGSIMSRGRTHNTNALFGARQKVYKIPIGSQASEALVVGRAMPGRAIYEDDARTSTFQRIKEKRRKMGRDDLSSSYLPNTSFRSTLSTSSSRPSTSDSSSSFAHTGRRRSLSAIANGMDRIQNQRSAALNALNFFQPAEMVPTQAPQISPTKHIRASRSFPDFSTLRLNEADSTTPEMSDSSPPPGQQIADAQARRGSMITINADQALNQSLTTARERRQRRVDEHTAKTLRRANEDMDEENRSYETRGTGTDPHAPSCTAEMLSTSVEPSPMTATGTPTTLSLNRASIDSRRSSATSSHRSESMKQLTTSAEVEVQNPQRRTTTRTPRLRLSVSMHNLAPPLHEHPAMRTLNMPQVQDEMTGHGSGLGGLVKAHLRDTSDYSLLPSAISTYPSTQDLHLDVSSSMSSSIACGPPPPPTQLSYLRRRSTSSLISAAGISPDEGSFPSAESLHRRRPRATSIETQQERDAFDDELAQRQKAIQENIKVLAEQQQPHGRLPGPAGSRNVFDQSFRGLLPSKSNHDLKPVKTMKSPAMPSVVRKASTATKTVSIAPASRAVSSRPSLDLVTRTISRESTTPSSMGRTLHSRLPRQSNDFIRAPLHSSPVPIMPLPPFIGGHSPSSSESSVAESHQSLCIPTATAPRTLLPALEIPTRRNDIVSAAANYALGSAVSSSRSSPSLSRNDSLCTSAGSVCPPSIAASSTGLGSASISGSAASSAPTSCTGASSRSGSRTRAGGGSDFERERGIKPSGLAMYHASPIDNSHQELVTRSPTLATQHVNAGPQTSRSRSATRKPSPSSGTAPSSSMRYVQTLLAPSQQQQQPGALRRALTPLLGRLGAARGASSVAASRSSSPPLALWEAQLAASSETSPPRVRVRKMQNDGRVGRHMIVRGANGALV